MGPEILIFTTKRYFLYYAINIRTQKALNLRTLPHRTPPQLLTPLTVPLPLWQLPQQPPTIASLVHGAHAKPANDDFIAFVVILLQAYVTYNICVIFVLVGTYLLVGIFGVEITVVVVVYS